MSTLSSVVSNLVRAQMGASVPSTVSDDDLDRVTVDSKVPLRRLKLRRANCPADAVSGSDELINDVSPKVAVDSGGLREQSLTTDLLRGVKTDLQEQVGFATWCYRDGCARKFECVMVDEDWMRSC